MRRAALARGLARGAFAVAVLVLVGEVLLRLADATQPWAYGLFPARYDTSRSYNHRLHRPKPHAYLHGFRLNAGGFHDLEFTKRGPGVLRIVALGDSFAFGMVPYAQNYLTLLEEDLRAAGRPVELLNMGLPGLGPAQYRELFLDEGLGWSPDLVLVNVYVGNDLQDRTGFPARVYRRWPLESLYVVALTRSLRHMSEAGFGGADMVRVWLAKLRAGQADAPLPARLARAVAHRELELHRQEPLPEVAEGIASLLADVDAMRAACRPRTCRVVAILIPTPTQADESRQRTLLRSSGLREPLDFQQPTRALASALAARSIPYVDLLPEIRRAGRAEELYGVDRHWNAAGNRVAARALARSIGPELDRLEEPS